MQPNIIVDCERMKYPNTGLYYFCKYLSESIIKEQPEGTDSAAIYVQSSEKTFRSQEHFYYDQKWWHKIYNPIPSNFKVWHGTHQGSSYYPFNKKLKKILTIHDLNFLYDGRKSNDSNNKSLKKNPGND